MVREQIEKKLRLAFAPVRLDIFNESHRHTFAINLESHFKIVLVSDYFIGEPSLERHRLIYRVLSQELTGGVHALSLHIYSQKEWEEAQDSPSTPSCIRGADDLM